MKYSSLAILIFVLLSAPGCDDDSCGCNAGSEGGADNGDDGQADEDNPLVVGGSFIDRCVPELSSEGDDLVFMGYSGPDYVNMVGFYWELDDTDTPDSFRIDVWIEERNDDAPASPGTYDIPGPPEEPDGDFFDNSIQVYVTTPDQAFLAVADTGNITLVDYDIDDPVGSLFSGYLEVELQEANEDSTERPTDHIPNGCSGKLRLSWYGDVILDTK